MWSLHRLVEGTHVSWLSRCCQRCRSSRPGTLAEVPFKHPAKCSPVHADAVAVKNLPAGHTANDCAIQSARQRCKLTCAAEGAIAGRARVARHAGRHVLRTAIVAAQLSGAASRAHWHGGVALLHTRQPQRAAVVVAEHGLVPAAGCGAGAARRVLPTRGAACQDTLVVVAVRHIVISAGCRDRMTTCAFSRNEPEQTPLASVNREVQAVHTVLELHAEQRVGQTAPNTCLAMANQTTTSLTETSADARLIRKSVECANRARCQCSTHHSKTQRAPNL